MSHLYGFTELRETLSEKGDGRDGSVKVDDKAVVICRGLSDGDFFDLKSHTVRVWQGFIWSKRTWRRNESGEETSDFGVFDKWNNGGYLYRYDQQILLIRRVPEGFPKKSLIVEVIYSCIKIPNEKNYLVSGIDAKIVPIQEFCKYYGKKSGRLACCVIGGLHSLYIRTTDHLQSKANQMKSRAEGIGRFQEVITY
jgi:hypothetical protein